jgi:hypothetical protein
MAEAAKRVKLITTAGSNGAFEGFINASAAQTVTISGPFTFKPDGTVGGITMSAIAGQVVNVKCTNITPGLGNVWGLLA